MNGASEDGVRVRQDEYARALETWSGRLPELVRNINVVPHWIGGEDRFWFKLEDEAGHRFRMVDARTGTTTDAFDHERVAAALTAQGLDAQATALPIDHFDLVESDRTLIAVTTNGGYRVDLVDGSASPHRLAPPTEVPGPDGRVLLLRNNDLWLRDLDGHERALTQDGEPFNAWGVGNDYNLRRVATNRGESPPLPTNVFWSPDGRTVLAERVDERAIEPYPYVEFVPADGSARPKLHFIRETLVGEEPRPDIFALIDVESGERTTFSGLTDGLRLRPDIASIWWSNDGHHLYMVAQNLAASSAALVEFDRTTGKPRIVHRESASTYFDFNTYLYNLANVRLRQDGREFIWYSQQDGWGHLYAVDKASGARRQLTRGEWAVADIIAVTDTQLFLHRRGSRTRAASVLPTPVPHRP